MKQRKPIHLRLRFFGFALLTIVLMLTILVVYSPVRSALAQIDRAYIYMKDRKMNAIVDAACMKYLTDADYTEEDLKHELADAFLWSGFCRESDEAYQYHWEVAYTACMKWNDRTVFPPQYRRQDDQISILDYGWTLQTDFTKENAPFPLDETTHQPWDKDLHCIVFSRDDALRTQEVRCTRYLAGKDGVPIYIEIHALFCRNMAHTYFTNLIGNNLDSGLYLVLLILSLAAFVYIFTVSPLMEIAVGLKNGMPQLKLPIGKQGMLAEHIRSYYRREASLRLSDKTEITRLKTAVEYAAKAEENRRQMTSAIAHELKTPLAVIHSHAEALKSDISAEKRDHYLQVLLNETERMDEMVMEMLDLSRLEAGRIRLAQDEVDLQKLVSEAVDKFLPMAQQKQLQLSLDQKGGGTITADEGRLGQVVDNFLSNAIRYTPQGGEIRVEINTYHRTESAYARFSVENTAQHLSQEALDKVWETFYKTDKARSEKGTGLGLAIARNIVRLHGGECYVENTDLGVRFSFELTVR